MLVRTIKDIIMKTQPLLLLIFFIIGIVGCKKNHTADPIPVNPIDTIKYYCDNSSLVCRWRIDKMIRYSYCDYGYKNRDSVFPTGFLQLYADSTFISAINDTIRKGTFKTIVSGYFSTQYFCIDNFYNLQCTEFFMPVLINSDSSKLILHQIYEGKNNKNSNETENQGGSCVTERWYYFTRESDNQN